MASPYIGEIRCFGFSFAPVGWAWCNGQLMAIALNDALFAVIGTTYGGDGQSTFALPNLQSRVPIHTGNGKDGVTYTLAEMAGTESVTLTTQQMPVHTHTLLASTNFGNTAQPNNLVLGASSTFDLYVDSPATSAMSPLDIGGAGGSQPHENSQPFLCINFIISLFGIFPSQT